MKRHDELSQLHSVPDPAAYCCVSLSLPVASEGILCYGFEMEEKTGLYLYLHIHYRLVPLLKAITVSYQTLLGDIFQGF